MRFPEIVRVTSLHIEYGDLWLDEIRLFGIKKVLLHTIIRWTTFFCCIIKL